MTDSGVRRWTLHCVLSAIMGGWNRRFRKNHFLAWKFYTRTIAGNLEAKRDLMSQELLKGVFVSWALLPETSLHEKQTAELKHEAETARRNAANQLLAFSEQLKAAQVRVDEAEQEVSIQKKAVIAARSSAQEQLSAVSVTKEAELEALTQMHQETAETRTREHARQLAELENAHANQLQKLKESMGMENDARIVELKAEQASKTTAMEQELVSAMDSARLQALAAQNTFAEEMDKVAKKHHDEVQALKEKHATETRSLSDSHQATLEEREKALRVEIEALQAQVNAAAAEHSAVRARNEQTIDELKINIEVLVSFK